MKAQLQQLAQECVLEQANSDEPMVVLAEYFERAYALGRPSLPVFPASWPFPSAAELFSCYGEPDDE